MTSPFALSAAAQGVLAQTGLAATTAAQRSAFLAAMWAAFDATQLATVITAMGAADLVSVQALTNKTLGNTNTLAIKDTLFTLQDDGDATKTAQFDLSGIAAGQQRTITLPNANITMVGTTNTQTLSGKTLTAPTITSPTITGTSVAPTQAQGDNTTQIATTAFVQGQWIYGELTGDYTLTSQTAAQKLFNIGSGSGGALTLPTGYYQFQSMLYLTTMDAGGSSNGQFDLKGAGGATLANIGYITSGADSSTPTNAQSQSGCISVTSASVASMVAGATGTGLGTLITGQFNVTVTGTVIPSIALAVAAAAVVKAGSWFRCRYMGATGSNTNGPWS